MTLPRCARVAALLPLFAMSLGAQAAAPIVRLVPLDGSAVVEGS